MSENGQTHFKNLATNAARLLSVSDQFGTLCIKGLITLLDTLRNCGINSERSVENML